MDKAVAECPKCSSRGIWVEEDGVDTWLRCVCGFLLVVETKLEGGMLAFHSKAPTKDNLPRRGTKLSKCLGALALYRPTTTGDIAIKLDQDSSDTASQLTVLQAKGLVVRLKERRGISGGSTWDLSPYASKLLAT